MRNPTQLRFFGMGRAATDHLNRHTLHKWDAPCPTYTQFWGGSYISEICRVSAAAGAYHKRELLFVLEAWRHTSIGKHTAREL